MAYDNPLSALQDCARIMRHLAESTATAAGALPMIDAFERHVQESRDAMNLPPRATEPLPPPASLEPEPAPLPPASEPEPSVPPADPVLAPEPAPEPPADPPPAAA